MTYESRMKHIKEALDNLIKQGRINVVSEEERYNRLTKKWEIVQYLGVPHD